MSQGNTRFLRCSLVGGPSAELRALELSGALRTLLDEGSAEDRQALRATF